AHAPGGRPPACLALGDFEGRQLAARPGVGALGQRAVRSGRRVADLGARAPASVQEPGTLEPPERVRVQLLPFGLAHRFAIPVEADRAQVRELLRLELATDASGVQVLDAHEEARAPRA